jgi:putative ABC transport system permease protein
VSTIPIINIGLSFLPVGLVLVVMFYWSLNITDGFVALSRMLIQLLLIGYALTWIFSVDSSLVVLAILSFMLLAASSIALRPLSDERVKGDYWRALFSIALGGGSTLFFGVLVVLNVDPWYKPTTVIPLAGMIFASSMNTISISAERFSMEVKNGSAAYYARNQAYKAGLIPIFNSLLAVGLVSFPGMMTGQILSGVSPLIAVRYQIVVMCMLTGASGIATAIYLHLRMTKSQ